VGVLVQRFQDVLGTSLGPMLWYLKSFANQFWQIIGGFDSKNCYFIFNKLAITLA
jgi:hypothetical protein